MNKLKTWLRIKKRMMIIHLAEAYVFIEWPIKLLVNWIVFLSFPVWIGTVYMIHYAMLAWESTKKNKHAERAALTGRIWFWEVYRIY